MTLRTLVLAAVAVVTTGLFPPAALAAPTLDAPVADDGVAQDEDDDLDDILGTSSDSSSVRQERRDIEREAATDDGQIEVQLPEAKKKLIRILQPKTFLKIGRFEFVPQVGVVTNDPFIRRIMFGAALGYHFTEVFELELQGSFAPNFQEGDWKAITKQITAEGANQVAPEISRQMWHLTLNFNYSPFYGKVATRKGSIVFDVYASFGTGIVGTLDDLALIGNEDVPEAVYTERQVHPALSLGGGLRIAFNRTFALRLEGRTISYIGVLESRKLELKNNLTVILGASIFFGRRFES